MLANVIRCIIFDLDGTLVHSLPGIAASLNRSLSAQGLPTHPESAVRNFIGNGIKKLVERAAPDAHGNTLDGLVNAMRDDYAETWKDGTQPYPKAVETLQNLASQNIPCAVFSNKPDEYCREITDHLFSGIPFQVVQGQREGTPPKPDPAGALEIAQTLRIPTTETAFVGDSTIDLETANNAHMIPVAATWGYHDPPALAALSPKHSINSINELLSLITP